jgi:hypothetical protein
MVGKVQAAIAILLIISAFTVTAFAQNYSQPGGKIAVRFDAETLDDELAALISSAQAILAETRVSTDGSDIPRANWWANQPAHNTFSAAITAAQTALEAHTDEFTMRRGATFAMTVEIENNPGFAGMFFRVYVPQGLELIGFAPQDSHSLQDGLIAPECENQNPPSESNPLTGNIVMGWAGRKSVFHESGELFTIKFRVCRNAETGQLNQIALSFANERGGPNATPVHEPPTNFAGEELQITLPGGITWQYTVYVATVKIS